MFGSLLGKPEVRAVQATPWGDWGDGDNGTYGSNNTWAGNQVTNDSALRLLAVYGCVRLICDQILTLPLQRFRQQPEMKVELPRPQWLIEPVIGVSYVAWITQVLTSLLLDGNAYLAVSFTADGQISELLPLNAKVVRVKRVHGQRTFFVNGTPYSGVILHIPALMLAGSEEGLSPVEYARQTIGLGTAAQEHGARLFGQGAVMSGVIENPGKLPPGRARELARDWARAHSGSRRAHLPGVLTDGAKWVQTGLTNEQSQFLDTRKFTAVEIAGSMFGVDGTDLSLENRGSSLTYANLEQRSTHRMQMTLMPWIIRVENALSGLLPRPQFVKLNCDAYLRGDSTSRWSNYSAASAINTAAAAAGQPPVMLTQEMRELEDWDPLPEEAVPVPSIAPDVAATPPVAV